MRAMADTMTTCYEEYSKNTERTSNFGKNNIRCRWSFCFRKVKEFDINLNIKQSVSSSYNHQSNGQLEVCLTLIKQTLKKCFETSSGTYLALLQTRSTLFRPGLPSLAILLFNHLVMAMPQSN